MNVRELAAIRNMYCDQWRSQDLEVGGTEGLGEGRPQRGPSSQHITDIWLPNYA